MRAEGRASAPPMEFFRRLFRTKQPATPPLFPPVLSPAPQPAWGEELLAQLQKLSRANARLALHVEDLEKKVEGGFSEVLRQLSSSRAVEAKRPDDLFDALDALDEACVAARQLQPELADGLDRVARRIERVALENSYVRVKPHGQPPDGRLFKVVGAIPNDDLSDGLVARVVRAAITTLDGAPVREGEVLTSRKAS